MEDHSYRKANWLETCSVVTKNIGLKEIVCLKIYNTYFRRELIKNIEGTKTFDVISVEFPKCKLPDDDQAHSELSIHNLLKKANK